MMTLSQYHQKQLFWGPFHQELEGPRFPGPFENDLVAIGLPGNQPLHRRDNWKEAKAPPSQIRIAAGC